MSMERAVSHSQYVRAGLHLKNVNPDSILLPFIFDESSGTSMMGI